MSGRQVLALAAAEILGLVRETMCQSHCIHLVRLSCPCARKQEDHGDLEFPCGNLYPGQARWVVIRISWFWRKKNNFVPVTEAPARETASSSWRTWKGEGNHRYSLWVYCKPFLTPLFFSVLPSQVPHAQVPDVQPVCPNEAPLSRIWMAPNHPPGISVHEGSAAL